MDASSKYQLNWYSLIYPQNYMKNYKNIVCPLNLMLKPLLSASSKPIYTSTYYPLIICKENPLTASYYFSIFDLSAERYFSQIGLHKCKETQSTLPSQSCESEFNTKGKIARYRPLYCNQYLKKTSNILFLVSQYLINIAKLNVSYSKILHP